jgi:hypothetical protein
MNKEIVNLYIVVRTLNQQISLTVLLLSPILLEFLTNKSPNHSDLFTIDGFDTSLWSR